MKFLAIGLMVSLAALASDGPLERMFDSRLSVAQRNDACFSLRGQKDAEVREGMARALQLEPLRACASANLRVAGAVVELRAALADKAPEIRATAARELGSYQNPDLLGVLAQAAADPNLLVATNALYGLGQYADPAVLPYLEAIARRGGIMGIMALDRMHDLHDPEALVIARKLLNNSDVPDRVAAMKVLGDVGGAADLPALGAIAAKPEEAVVRQRGFGLMPAIDLSKAAKATMAQIQARLQ